ncbi:hypothetical protein ACFQ9X_44150 [Catenulispora yoronensis]
MTHDLKSSLDAFAEAAHSAAPPSTVDIDRARADGRRRLAAARLASLGGGVAVVAACALVVNALGGTTPAGKAPASTAGPAHRVFTGTDPLVAIGAFGWLPDGYRTTTRTTGPDYGDTLTAAAPMPAAADSSTIAPVKQLTLTRTGGEPQLAQYEQKLPTSLAGSTRAYFIVNPGDVPEIPADLSLAWQTASGDWYTLGGDYTIHGDALKARLTQVAESLRIGSTPVALPFHIEGLPAGVTLAEASLKDLEQGGFETGVAYQLGAAGRQNRGPSFSLTVTPVGQKPNASDQNAAAAVDLPGNLLLATPATHGNERLQGLRGPAGLCP